MSRADLIPWLSENKQWVFSGVGVFIVSGVMIAGRSIVRWAQFRRRAAQHAARKSKVLAGHEARAAIVLQNWLQLELAVVEAAHRVGCFGSPNSYMARRLRELGLMSDEQFATYLHLAEIAGRVASGRRGAIGPEDAARYPLVTAPLIQAILARPSQR